MKRGIIVSLAVAAAILIAAVQPASALYQWVDDKGILHITDYPPPSKAEPEPVDEPAKPAPAPSAPAPAVTAPTAAPVVPVTKPAATAVIPSTRPAGTAPAAAPGVLTLPTVSPQAAPTAAMPAPAAPLPPPVLAPEPSAPAAPEPSAGLVGAVVGSLLLVFLAVFAVIYLYYAYCMFTIAKRLNVEGAWAAWVPVVNFYWPVVGAAGKPIWWIILLLVPLVNIVVTVYLWMCISENCGKNKWLGLLNLVPLGPLFLWGYLAFARSE